MRIHKPKYFKMQTHINPEKYFYANDGKVFANLEDLFKGITEMSEETFLYHVNKEKNDFYNWVYYVFNDTEFAKAIQKVKTKTGFVKKVKDYAKATYNATWSA